jgi:hypothetical protein
MNGEDLRNMKFSYFLGETSLTPEVWLFLQIPSNIQKVSLTALELSIALNLDSSVQIKAQNF